MTDAGNTGRHTWYRATSSTSFFFLRDFAPNDASGFFPKLSSIAVSSRRAPCNGELLLLFGLKGHASQHMAPMSISIPAFVRTFQEIDRFNILMKRIKSTLLELRRAIAGEVILSFELEKMYNDFVFLRVPALWSKAGYPSLKPLGSWYDDFILRVAFLQKWLLEGRPPSYWISGFFFPQVCLAASVHLGSLYSMKFTPQAVSCDLGRLICQWEPPACGVVRSGLA